MGANVFVAASHCSRTRLGRGRHQLAGDKVFRASMGRKRPRPSSSAQLLAAATIAITPTPHAFVPAAAPLFFHGSSAVKLAGSRQHQLRVSNKLSSSSTLPFSHSLHAIPRVRGESGVAGNDDPNDPLPRTMEELYARMRSEPRVKQQQRDDVMLKPYELEFIEEAVRDVLGPTEGGRWWEEHGEEWDRMADNPEVSFSTGIGDSDPSFKWGMEAYFGQGAPEWKQSDEEAAPFSLSAYKAGILVAGHGSKVEEGEAGNGGPAAVADAGELFARTPFAQYWDSLPDVGVTKRVYAFNAVDRMAALKFMMKCTCNGMHGPAENHQPGHFLWGYADQLDWMRRSGRLSSTPGSIKVDRDSWWGRVSYALTIVPLAAVSASGFWQDDSVAILDGDDLQLPEMKRAVRAWRRVWRFHDVDMAMRVGLALPVHDALQERIRRAQWAAHLESLDAVEALYGKELDALPSSAEREFARGWCRAARLFAVAAAHTNLDKLIFPLGAGYPPERMLQDRTAGGEDVDRKQEGLPYAPPDVVAEAEADPVAALNTRRCVDSVRWLGTLRRPAFATLRILWKRACASYPSRREATRVLRRACYGGKRAKTAAWGKSFLSIFVPDINYRKLTPPFGIDPAEEVEYDLDMEPRDPAKPPPRPSGPRPLNPLQRPWYDGRRPDPLTGAPDEDDDGLAGTDEGMFPRGATPADMSFEALQRIEREIAEDLRRAKERLRDRDIEGVSRSDGREADRVDEGSGSSDGNVRLQGRLANGVGDDSETSTVFT